LCDRVRNLADRYVSRGDFWRFLQAVNEDYKVREKERKILY
jgi:hypothetical protein